MRRGFFTEKFKKIIGILVSIILFTQQVMLVNSKAEGGASVDPNDVTSQVDFIGPVVLYTKDDVGELTKEITPDLKIDASSTVKVEYEFTISNKSSIKKGQYCIIKLPKEINIQGLQQIKMTDKNEGEIATIDVQDANKGTLKMTFVTDFAKLRSDVKGRFKIQSTFIEGEYADGGKENLEFECGKNTFSKEVTFNDINREKPVITKTAGTYDPNNKTIPWTITVDCKDHKELKNVKVEDTLGPGQEFDETSLKIEDEKGNIITSYSKNYTYNDKGMPVLNIMFNKAISGNITINVVSILSDLTKLKNNKVENTVKLYSEKYGSEAISTTSAEKTIQVGIVQKTGEFDPKKKTITWNIEFNLVPELQESSEDNVIQLIDTFNLNEQNFNPDTNEFKVNGDDLPECVSYEEDNETKIGTMTIDLTKYIISSTGKTTVKYTTNVTNECINKYLNSGNNGFSITNKVQYKDVLDNTGVDIGLTKKRVPDLLNKIGTYDYKKNIVTWKVTLNKDEINFGKDFKVTDIIGDDQKYVTGSFKLLNKMGGRIAYDEGALGISEDGKKIEYSFKNDKRNSANKLYIMEYQTEVISFPFFEQGADSNIKKLENTVQITSKLFNTYSDKTIEKKTSCDVKVSPIEKIGEYKPNADVIVWKILINRNAIDMGNITITDDLNPQLKLDKSSLHLYKVNLPENNSSLVEFKDVKDDKEDNGFSIIKNVKEDMGQPKVRQEGNKFSFDIDNVEGPYCLIYSTKIRDKNSNLYNNGSVANVASITWKNDQDTTKRKGSSIATATKIHRVSGSGEIEGLNGTLIIHKVDETGAKKPIQGAEFKIWPENGDPNNEDDYTIATSDADGNVKFTGLRYENYYYVKETKVPDQYYLDDSKDITPDDSKDDVENDPSVKKIIINNGTERGTIEKTWVNTTKRGNVKVAKRDGESLQVLLGGAEFKLYKNEDISDAGYVGTLEYNSEKQFYELNNVPVGKYTIIETKAPLGFLCDKGRYTVEVKNKEDCYASNKNNGFFDDEAKKYSVKISKVDSKDSNKKLKGAEFKIYPSDKNDPSKPDLNSSLVKTLDEKDNGEYVLSEANNLRYGIYYLVESRAPKGYVRKTEYKKIVIDDETTKALVDNSIEEYYTNEQIKGTIVINKVDKENHKIKLSSAKFQVYQDDGDGVFNPEKDICSKLIEEGTSGTYKKEVEYEFNGIYWVKELNAPTGYYVDRNGGPNRDGIYKIQLDDSVDDSAAPEEKKKNYFVVNNLNSQNDNTFENQSSKIKEGTLTLTKVDEEYPENKLTGAEFEVYEDFNGDGNPDEDAPKYKLEESKERPGVYTSKKLRLGKYLVLETKAPEGFIKDEKYHSVEITGDNQEVPVETEAGKNFINKRDTSEIDKEEHKYNEKPNTNIDKDKTHNKDKGNADNNREVVTSNKEEITVNSTGNIADKINYLKEAIKTGDDSKLGILIGIASISLILLLVIGISSKRKKKTL